MGVREKALLSVVLICYVYTNLLTGEACTPPYGPCWAGGPSTPFVVKLGFKASNTTQGNSLH